MGSKLRPGRLLRFSLLAGGFTFSAQGVPAGAELRYEGPANQRRGKADQLHKVLFQYHARRGGMAFEQLTAAAVGVEGAADDFSAALATEAMFDAHM